ncbi:MAG: hypothetical protein DMG15_27625 [Acidobacteria bacterium]|nr:MAG: hypothetical protein DMG16_10715 [Acidobacteriota bacterium]PYS08273.1 MAG: hypothetical protein DMG15_27625 [Acidobacteriota bacterium]
MISSTFNSGRSITGASNLEKAFKLNFERLKAGLVLFSGPDIDASRTQKQHSDCAPYAAGLAGVTAVYRCIDQLLAVHPRRNAVGRRCPHHATLMPAITWACCSSPPASDPMRWRSSKPFCDTTPITPRHDALAAALYESGRFTEAVAEFTQTMRLNPNWAGVRDNLKLARRAAGITK